jgi:CheY-like chemotaxis protein
MPIVGETVFMTKPLLLLVDDAPDMAVVVRVLSKHAGIELAHRLGVADGWAALHERTPDLLLLDMRLAGENGADLCRRLRTSPTFGQLRVALFTTWGMHEDIRAGLEAGADLVFDKDLVVQPDEWRRRLAEILAWMRGRVWAKLVAWKTEPVWPDPPPDWPTVYNHALRQAVARLSASVLRVLLQRTLRGTFAQYQRHDDAQAWLHPAEAAFAGERLLSAEPETVAFLGVSLAEQMWCMLGSRDSAFFTAALAPVVPGLTEALLN